MTGSSPSTTRRRCRAQRTPSPSRSSRSPLLGAVVAYATLFFRVTDAAARYRIALVALGLLVWITTEGLAYVSGVSNTSAGEMTRRLLALGSTILIYYGYQAPAWAQRRWGAKRAFSG